MQRTAPASPGSPPSRLPGLRLPDLLGVRDQTDEAGRLLLEDSAPKKARRRVQEAGVAMQSVRCDFRDSPSRQGGLMNASAYDALRRDTAEVLDGFAWLGGRYFGRHPDRRSTVRALFDLSYLGLTLPLVAFHRAERPVPAHGRLPSYAASLFKASRGVFSATVDLMNEKGPAAAIDAAGVVAFAEARGHLVRAETQRVCAAPTRLIERTIGVVITGGGADPARSRIGDLVDFGMLWDFYVAQESCTQAFSDYRFTLDGLLAKSPGAGPSDLFARTVSHRGRAGTFGQLTEAVLVHVNEAQAGMNRALGRSEAVAPVTFDELLRLL